MHRPQRDRQDRQEAQVVGQHLDRNFAATPETISNDAEAQRSDSQSSAIADETQSSLQLQGGDVHRELYKIDARARLNAHKRSQSQPEIDAVPVRNRQPGASSTGVRLDLPSQSQRPGGFRRAYMAQQSRRALSVAVPINRSFVQFLDLYGSFAGEDLADTDSEDDDDDTDYFSRQHRESEQDDDASERQRERRPLLQHRRSTKRGQQGDAGTTKTFFLLLKSFIGTGVLFLPKAFRNGGLAFSSAMLLAVSLVTCLAFHLLLQCRARHPGGYGDIGAAIAGPKMRIVILVSVALSQIGFVCAGVIFTAENMRSFLDAVTRGGPPLSTNMLIAIQILLLLPLTLIRNMSKLGSAALLADACILLGLSYIYYYDVRRLIKLGGLEPSVVMFNPSDFALTIGSTIFTFEGIGLILPIQQSMKKPERFGALLYGVMFLITVVFAGVGFLSYAAFGEKTKVEIIDNLPQMDKFVNAVQFLYSLAILVGTPVQLFPAVRILEGYVFGRRSGKRDAATKWKKNGFRVAVTCVAGFIAAAGADDLDKFVALLGSVACIPLVYIYPAFLHYKGVAEGKIVKTADLFFIACGCVACVFTGFITIKHWVDGTS